MTQEQIQHYVETIKQATAKASKSPEASRRFLVSAGIIEDEPKTRLKSIKPKKQKP